MKQQQARPLLLVQSVRSRVRRAQTRARSGKLIEPQPVLSNHRVLHQPAGVLQAKLVVGKPNDQFEQEADRVADQVMRMPGGMRDSGTDVLDPSNHSLQRKCSCGATLSPTGECENCRKKRLSSRLHGA